MRLSNTALIFVIFASAILLSVISPLREFFTSPGTMVQLTTSHVPTAEDYNYYNNIYQLRPWAFPYAGGYYMN